MKKSVILICFYIFTNGLYSQQTVFYNWLRYNQQKILPNYESSDYWCGNGFIETPNRYIVPYTTTDFKYGEGGFFVLHKNGILDSVLLWDIYNPLIKENNIVDIIKISSNRYYFQRMLTDTFGKNYSDFVFVDSNFKEIKKVDFYRNNGLMIPTGLYLGYDKQSVIAKIYYYLKDANGQVTGFNKSELLRVDTNGTITVLYTQLGRGSNWIFEFALDTSDSTYMICSQNDIATTNNYDHKDTLLYTKMKPSGEIVWQYKWYEYSNKYLFWVHKPNMVINEQGYTFIHYFKDTDNDTSVGVLVRIHRDGKGHKIIKKYYRYELRDKPEFILPFDTKSHYRFGYSVGAINEIVYDTQQHDSVLNYSIYIAKIDTSGNILWTKRHNTNNPNIEYMRDWRSLYCVRRVEDGGYLLIGSGIGTFKNLPPYQNNNYALVIKTDSCGFGSRDTCKIIPKIDSIRYNTVYISLDENKVCGRRWYVDGKIFQSERLEYSFSDTGTYTIGIWGFAGATTDSIAFDIHIDSFTSRILDHHQKQLSIYPNPASTLIQLSDNTSEYTVTLSNLLGQKVYEDNGNLGSYDISKVERGIYLLNILNKKGEVVKIDRLVVNR